MVASPLELALLAAAAFAAGFFDAIGGGGGLLTVPALLATGLGPHQVLATNKGQACLGAAASLLTFLRRGGLDRERLPLGMLAGFVGSLAGAWLVLRVPPEPLKPLMLVLLAAAGVVLLFRSRLARPAERRGRLGAVVALGLIIGAYDGFFGPGTGTLLIIGFLHFMQDSPTRASGNAKIINFGSNLAALVLFQSRGAVLWEIALPMGLCNVLGATLGARVALKHGDRLVRGVVLVALLAIAIKVLLDLLEPFVR